tara:strand:+ start:1092 stop:1589 length:498 start_codon:yes stop_codon:yes gene_type:complete
MKNPIKRFKEKRCERKYPNGRYAAKSISRKDKARAIDLILGLCAQYYSENGDEVTFDLIEDCLYKELCMHSIESELIMKIMIQLELIRPKLDDNENIISVTHTIKGVGLYLDGGKLLKTKKKINTEWLIKIGQWSVGLGGLYYLLRILTDSLPKLFSMTQNLFCS